MKVGYLKMIVVNVGAIARNCEEYIEERSKLSRMQTYDSHIDKGMRAYKMLNIAQELTEELSNKNGVLHEIDIDAINVNIIYIISKMRANGGQMGIKGSVNIKDILIQEDYEDKFKREVFNVVMRNEEKLIDTIIDTNRRIL